MEQAKKRITDLAREMFSNYGYSRVSMDEIAAKLGMSKRTLYKYFSSKEFLLDQTVEVFMQEMSQEAERVYSDVNLDFYEKLKQIFTLVGTNISSLEPDFVEDIIRNAPSVWVKIQEFKQKAAFMRFSGLLDEGIKNGIVRADVDKTLAVMLYASAIETIISPAFTKQFPKEITKELPYSVSAIFEGLVKIIFEGIQVRN